MRKLEKDVEAARFDAPEGKIELPVKLRVYELIFVPLAKWAMLCAGNYRCITADGMRTAQEAVHSNLEESRSVYNFVNDLCVKLGASPDDLVPFEKYAAAAQSLTRPASAARALNNGAPNIERADKLVQLIARQKGLSHPTLDATVALVDSRLDANRKKARGLIVRTGISMPAIVTSGACRSGRRQILVVRQRLSAPIRSYSHAPSAQPSRPQSARIPVQNSRFDPKIVTLPQQSGFLSLEARIA